MTMTAIQTNNETDQQTLEGDYENPWTYKGTTFTSNDIDGFFGYVYCITNLTTGRRYIGSKSEMTYRGIKFKKELCTA